MRNTEWKTGTYDNDIVARLMERLGIPSLTAKLLAVRGICEESSARRFMEKDLRTLNDPFLLCDMQKAVDRIEKAIENKEKIAVYGDYDADGVTATYIMVHYLRFRGAECTYHIPDRFEDGYGLSGGALKVLSDGGVSLVITVDTGITAIEEVKYAAELGLDVVITDHHKCGESLPDAVAIVNPNREDCTYPFPHLAGVGVAFKLISAMSGSDREIMEKYLPYVCIGTVADVMPIIDENRAIVARGIRLISERREVGITALLDAAGSRRGEDITSGGIGFLIGPRMNAAGRMGSATLALDLLFANEDNAAQVAQKLNEKNSERQRCEGQIMKEALSHIEEHPEYKEKSAIVISGEGWHHGVLGIVASRVCNMLGKPTILISVEDGECRGSGRSVAGVSLHSALGRCSDLLVKFGGHDLAAGIVVKRENIDRFRERLNEELRSEMADFVPVLGIDFEAKPEELTIEQVRSLDVMEPFGKFNEAPVLRINRCKVSKIVPIGNGSHTKLVVEHAGRFQCVYFGKKCDSLPFVEGDYADLAFTPQINKMYGTNVQLHIKDARPCEEDIAEITSAINVLSEERTEGLEISYNELGCIWRMITSPQFPKSFPLTFAKRKLFVMDRGITLSKLLLAFEIFSEVGLMSFEISDFRVLLNLAEHNNKVDLNDSETYRIYKSCGSR
ncbi:MAG: single-stranded-DNA-specific exonuclease RecJ [Oscillospiraceae bacterium]|nr:single-stranded-DNA-specific exonuclease RecJ [Oscillospiraceae bacterium]